MVSLMRMKLKCVIEAKRYSIFCFDLLLLRIPGNCKSRFMGVSVPRIQSDRIGTHHAKTARELGIVCVLKGANTVISDGKRERWSIPPATPRWRRGGMGDVLTGVIASLLALRSFRFSKPLAPGFISTDSQVILAAIGDRGLLAGALGSEYPARFITHSMKLCAMFHPR